MSPRSRALGALAAATLFGFAVGVVADRVWLAAQSSPAGSDAALVAATTREVGFDSAQVGAVRAILARHQQTVDSAWRLIRPNVHAAIVAAQLEIAMVLRPDQRERYRRWIRGAHAGMAGDSVSSP